MSGFYITRLRLDAADFPGQVTLFTALKRPVYFRNNTLEYIQHGGWAELPKDHYEAFVKALKDGYVRGERMWHLDYHQFVQRWRTPAWVEGELTNADLTGKTPKLDNYIARCKELLDANILRPFTNNPRNVPPQVIEYIVSSLEKTPVEDHQAEFYSMIYSNLETRPNKDIAHRAFLLLQKKTKDNPRYSQVDILNNLSLMNAEDRKAFMAWMFKSPKQLSSLRESNYSVSDIIMSAVLRGEVWYKGQPNENQGTVSGDARSEESSSKVLNTPDYA